MYKRKPDFYLTSADSITFTTPRKCWIKEAPIESGLRNDGIWIEVDKPIPGSKYGLDDHEIKDLIIFSRHDGYTLLNITEWPVDVYIYCLILKHERSRKITPESLKMIAWGEIYDSQDAADESASQY